MITFKHHSALWVYVLKCAKKLIIKLHNNLM